MSTSFAPTPTLRARALKLAEAATTPLVPGDFLDLFDPLRTGAELRGRVESVHPETADAATLVIRPGADWAGHVPGQYLRIGIDVDGVRQWRAYSLTHGPRRDGRISITVKAVPDGLVSNHLVHEARPGTLVHLEQAAGEFVLPPEGGKFLMVTAGSGITPVIGMLRNLFPSTDDGVLRPARSADHDIVVVHVAPSHPHSIFIRDLEVILTDDLLFLDFTLTIAHQHINTSETHNPNNTPDCPAWSSSSATSTSSQPSPSLAVVCLASTSAP